MTLEMSLTESIVEVWLASIMIVFLVLILAWLTRKK